MMLFITIMFFNYFLDFNKQVKEKWLLFFISFVQKKVVAK